MKSSVRVLLVDDDEEEFAMVRDMLRRVPPEALRYQYELEWAGTYQEGLEALDRHSHDLYIFDYHLGEKTGLDLLKYASVAAHQAPIIILTGQSSYDIDLTAMQYGAADYLIKDQMTPFALERSMRYALERAQTLSELERLVEERTQDLEQANQVLLTEINRRREAAPLQPGGLDVDDLAARLTRLNPGQISAALDAAGQPDPPAAGALLDWVSAGPDERLQALLRLLLALLSAVPVTQDALLQWLEEGR